MENPTPQQALENLARASAEYRGTRADHEMLARSINVFAQLIAPKPEVPPATPPAPTAP